MQDTEQDPWMDEKAELLGEIPLFASLDQAAKERLVAAGKIQRHWNGECVVSEGEPGTSLFLVMRGSVRVTTRKPGAVPSARGETFVSDDVIVLGKLGRGGCFGEVALMSGQLRTATVTAAEETMLVRFDDSDLTPLLAEFPRVKRMLDALVVGRAKDTVQKLGG